MVHHDVVIFYLCVDVMEMSSAYEVSCSGAGSCGISDVYVLRSVHERTPP